jgi:O-antigen/teichoic acid export membrane protein
MVVRCLKLLTVATVPLATLIGIFAEDIVGMVFGSEFLPASVALQVLAWTLPIRGAQWLLGSQLAALDRQAQMAKARSIGLGSFLTLTPLLILGAGLTGLAWAVLICDALQFALYWRLLRRLRFAPPLSRAVLPPACAALGGIVVAGLSVDLPLLPRVLVVALALASGLWIFGAIRPRDLGLLRG